MMYSAAFLFYMLIASPRYLFRAAKGRYRSSFRKRLGTDLSPLPAYEGGTVWIHACSVGEVEASVPFVRKLEEEHPEWRLVISTVTETGQDRAENLYPEHEIRYLPFDLRMAIRSHLDAVGELEALFVMETEIWPNLFEEFYDRGIPIFIVNGRISDRAWKRYRAFSWVFQSILARVTYVGARTETDARRFKFLGVRRISITGNVKFDRPAAPPPQAPPKGRIILFGSSHPGETDLFLSAFDRVRKTYPEMRAIMAPRHIETASEILRKCEASLRSVGWGSEPVLVLDSHGELGSMYLSAEVAVIGGSFIAHGGHNPLEAAVQGVPVIWGPSMENFRDACSLLIDRGGFEAVDESKLVETLLMLLADPMMRRRLGEVAKKQVRKNTGATVRTWEMVSEHLQRKEAQI